MTLGPFLQRKRTLGPFLNPRSFSSSHENRDRSDAYGQQRGQRAAVGEERHRSPGPGEQVDDLVLALLHGPADTSDRVVQPCRPPLDVAQRIHEALGSLVGLAHGPGRRVELGAHLLKRLAVAVERLAEVCHRGLHGRADRGVDRLVMVPRSIELLVDSLQQSRALLLDLCDLIDKLENPAELVGELPRLGRLHLDAGVKPLHELLGLGAALAEANVDVIEPLDDFEGGVDSGLGLRRLGLDLRHDGGAGGGLALPADQVPEPCQ